MEASPFSILFRNFVSFSFPAKRERNKEKSETEEKVALLRLDLVQSRPDSEKQKDERSGEG